MTAEIRGRGRKWRVWYSDESGLSTPHLVYNRDGVVVGTIEAGAPTGKLVEAHLTCTTQGEALDYARWLGATEINVRRTMSQDEALAKAQKAAARKRAAA